MKASNADLNPCEFAFICGYTLCHNVDANSIVKKGDVLAALDVKRLTRAGSSTASDADPTGAS